MTSALKLREVVKNAERVLTIELLSAGIEALSPAIRSCMLEAWRDGQLEARQIDAVSAV